MGKHFLNSASIFFGVIFIAGCATSEKIQVQQIGDQNFACNELMMEMQKLDQAEREIQNKKGVTGTNVASALFWLPGLAYTYYDAGQAEELINNRRAHLTGLYNSKNCG